MAYEKEVKNEQQTDFLESLVVKEEERKSIDLTAPESLQQEQSITVLLPDKSAFVTLSHTVNNRFGK